MAMYTIFPQTTKQYRKRLESDFSEAYTVSPQFVLKMFRFSSIVMTQIDNSSETEQASMMTAESVYKSRAVLFSIKAWFE